MSAEHASGHSPIRAYGIGPHPVQKNCGKNAGIPREMAGSLPQRLEESAVSVGYTGRIRGVPREVLRNRKLLHFLQWAVECLEPANCLSQTQLEKWVELQCSLVTQLLPIVCIKHQESSLGNG